MATTIPSQCATIDEFIEAGAVVRITYSALSLIDQLIDVDFPSFNVIDDYMDDIKSEAIEVELNDEEARKYYQAPKLLANDIYKNSELDFIIMRLNGIYDEKDFVFKKLYLVRVDTMNTLLSKILNAEKKYIDDHNAANTAE